MERNIFSPRLSLFKSDSLSDYLLRGAQWLFLLTLVLLPLIYLSEVSAPLGFQKTLFLSITIYLSVLLLCLSVLRQGAIQFNNPIPWLIFAVFIGVSLVAGLLSQDATDSIWGVFLETQTVAFMVLLLIVFTLTQFLFDSVSLVKRFILGSLITVGILLWLSVSAILMADWRPILLPNGASLAGSLNDLALLSGLVIVGLITAIQVATRTTAAKALTLLLITPALFILVVVNFSLLWILIAFFSLLSLLYLLSKDTWLKSDTTTDEPVGRLALAVVGLTCVVSGAFVVSGDYLSQRVSGLTDINYLEVRPSLLATTGVMNAVYQSNLLLGVGPNRFEDAWRLHKSPSIADTQFWNTNFVSGYSLISNLFVTTGLLGGITFLGFLLYLLCAGYRLLYRMRQGDWSLYIVSSGVYATVIMGWIMTALYTPGVVVLTFLFALSGLLLALSRQLEVKPLLTLNVREVRQHGLVLIAGVLFIIVGLSAALLQIGKQFNAYTTYAAAQADFVVTGDTESYDLALARAFDYFEQDIYLSERARLRLGELTRLVALPEASTEAEQRFELAFTEGIDLANRSTLIDPTNPYNYALRASFLSLLPETLDEGLAAERQRVFAQARELDPRNPEYYLLEAQLLAQRGEAAAARDLVRQALTLKADYIEALAFLTELEIGAGNTTAALEATRTMININPTNPARYFQLGLLESAAGNVEGAYQAFMAALRFDPSYANARYLAAIALLDLGRVEEAIVELRRVQETNADNQELADLIASLEAGEISAVNREAAGIQSGAAINQVEETVTTDQDPESPLLSPVNRVPERSTDQDAGSSLEETTNLE